MIDPLSETTLTLSAAARRLPRLRSNRPVHPSTLWRWATCGIRGIRLETTRLGGTTVTSTEALRRFFARLNGESAPSVPVLSAPAVEAELDRILGGRGRD
jgi:hypothetical protein